MLDSENQFNKAEQFLNEKKYLHALQLFQSLLNIPNFKRKSLIKLIEIYEIQNQYDFAVKAFEDYLSKAENDENMRMYYAQFLFRHKKYNDANHILSGISVSGRPEKNFLMGLSNYFLAEYEIAMINFKDFISQKISPELVPEAHLYIAKCLIKNSDLDSALKHLKKSEELDKQNFSIYFALAEVYYSKEMYYHAIENIQRSTKLNPLEKESIKLCGKIFFKLGEYEKAKNLLEQSITKGNEDNDILAILGTICINLNDFKSANSYFNDALKINPFDEIARNGLLECKSKTK